MIELSAKGIRLSFDAALGLIEQFIVYDDEKEIAPLHRAPWVGSSEEMPDGIAPHLIKLGGDFFCAPFGATEGASPLHGWPPNSSWTIKEQRENYLCAELDKSVFGAQLVKELTLRDGHPFVYQRHTFIGGEGQVPVANHANLSLPNGGVIRTSPKTQWRTPPAAQETDPARGRSGLIYPTESNNAAAFPGREGIVDLTRYPWFPNCEDFVVGLEEPGHQLGWTAVSRPIEGDVFLSLRSAAALPMTMLWHSNGGRDFAPWSGRHFGCLGVEEGAAASILGMDAKEGSIDLDGSRTIQIMHVIGAVSWRGGAAIRSIDAAQEHLILHDDDGVIRKVPFDAAGIAEKTG